MDIFAKNLRNRAEELRLQHAEVARRAGLTDQRYGNYVSGRREPDLATLVRIARALATTPNVLLGVDGAATSDDDFLHDKISSAVGALNKADREIVAACAEAILQLRSG